MELVKDIKKSRISQNDEITEFLKEVSNREVSKSFSGLKFSLYENSLSTLNQEDSFGPLEPVIDKMNHEIDQLITHFNKFYFSKLDYKEYTPQEVNSIIKYYLLRIKRMKCVIEPEYSVIKFFDKKSKNHYQMIKGYWIDDNGKRVRSLSRNVGNTEATIEDLAQKFLTANIPNAVTMEPANVSHGVDFLIYDGTHKWGVEVKFTNRDSFIKTFVGFELWKLYKKEYELIE